RDLLDQPRESAATLRTHAGVRVDREPANVQLVNDGVRLVSGPPVLAPVEHLAGSGEQAQRCLAGVGPGARGRCQIEGRGEEGRLRVRIREDLVRVEAVPLEAALGRGAGYRVGIKARAADVGPCEPAVPDTS